MARVSDDVLAELIENDGCRRGSPNPINAAAIVRLALDLQEARSRIKNLELNLLASAETIKAIGRLSKARVDDPTEHSSDKRTKKR